MKWKWKGREREKKSRVEYRVELSANICHSCAGIFASYSYPSLSSLGLVTIPRIDSSDGKLPTGLARLEFFGGKMEIVSIFLGSRRVFLFGLERIINEPRFSGFSY